MRFNKDLLFWLILCTVWLSGCAASAPRPSEAQPSAQPSATPTDTTSQRKAPAISPSARREYKRALAAMKSNRDKQAERILLAMTQTYRDLAGPHVNLGIIYYRSGRVREAEQAFRKAIAISPHRADIYNHLGIVLRKSGRFSEAREAYENALQLDAFYAYAHLNLGILYDLYLLDADSALRHYELYQKSVATRDQQVAKWIVDLKRRMRRFQKTAVR